MLANILSKVGGGTESVDTSDFKISTPSIVQLKIAPEDVRTFERDGANLKMILLKGQVVVVEGFFAKDAEGHRSDLVLEDNAGVLWWGQYPSEWEGFHFTEIEEDSAAVPPWMWAGLGLLGLGGVALAAGGGGGGGGGNHPPAAGHDSVHGSEDSRISGNVLLNDNDPDGDPLRVTQFSVDVNGDGKPDVFNAGDTAKIQGVGELTVNPDGSYTFTPEPNWNGKVPPVDYTVTDGNGGTDHATLDITVDPVQDPPVATDDLVVTDEDTPVTGNVLANDHDPDGDPLTVTEFRVDTDGDGTPETFKPGETAEITGVGELTINSDGSYTFTPEPGWNGDVPTVSYTITDGQGGTDAANLNITANPVDDPVHLTNLTDDAGGANGSDIVVYESSLAGGSDAGGTGTTASGSFTVDAQDGIHDLSIIVDGTDYALVTDNVFSAQTIITGNGSTLDITGYDAATGELSYTYTLNGAQTHGAAGVDDIYEQFGVTLTDMDGDTTSDTLGVRIVDDVPEAKDDGATIAEDSRRRWTD
ncbi:Ig-like domain-containing protein [Candidimonas nitroreducens]|uniref:Uncharacterized protein n=1 Tax=Candidimonas nitroreducens TaxID=683354 RepID=A0A225LVT6_9BURK|nr:Ig-like domain-containing protein [Candidimonas nitroreducens]OWT53398.1 hypothetical protein CEY11_24715 [Candidimonas nitroreducens]